MQAGLLEGLCFICFFLNKNIVWFCSLGYSKNLYKVHLLLIAPVIVFRHRMCLNEVTASVMEISLLQSTKLLKLWVSFVLYALSLFYMYFNVRASPVIDSCVFVHKSSHVHPPFVMWMQIWIWCILPPATYIRIRDLLLIDYTLSCKKTWRSILDYFR